MTKSNELLYFPDYREDYPTNSRHCNTVSIRDVNSTLIVLLIYGTLYPQQSSLAPVWLFLNEIKNSQVDVQQLFTLLLIICVYYRPSIIACHVLYCDVSGRLVLSLLIN